MVERISIRAVIGGMLAGLTFGLIAGFLLGAVLALLSPTDSGLSTDSESVSLHAALLYVAVGAAACVIVGYTAALLAPGDELPNALAASIANLAVGASGIFYQPPPFSTYYVVVAVGSIGLAALGARVRRERVPSGEAIAG